MPDANDGPTSQKRRVVIAKAKDARDVTEEMMPREGLTETSAAAAMRMAEAGGVDGAFLKLLFEDETSGVSLSYVWFKPNFVLPRHSHNADCTYYVIAGEARFGTETLKAGDVFFVPADVNYAYEAGPDGVEILEFRTATRFNMKISNLGEAFVERAMKAITENRDRWRTMEAPEAVKRFSADPADA